MWGVRHSSSVHHALIRYGMKGEVTTATSVSGNVLVSWVSDAAPGADAEALPDINSGTGCEACGWNTNRESHMVTIRTSPDGTPAVWADPCIADLVRALNAAGFRTIASCCGHRSDVQPSVVIDWSPPSGAVSPAEMERVSAAVDAETACGWPSGWHDDGDPMVCVLPDGHDGKHYQPDIGPWSACGHSGTSGGTYSCVLAEMHGGPHYDPLVDSSWPGTEGNRFEL